MYYCSKCGIVGLYPLPMLLSVMSCVVAIEIAMFFIKKI